MTEAKRRANQANGRLSRGPVTEAGKAVSSQNALQHGLQSRRVLLPGEDPDEYQGFCDDFYREWQPVGIAETVCLEQMISAAWRLGRVPWIEGGLLRGHMYNERVPPKPNPPTEPALKAPSTDELAIACGFTQPSDDDWRRFHRDKKAYQHTKETHDRALHRAERLHARTENHLGRAFAAVGDQGGIANLLRYQTKLERSFGRALRALLELRGARSAQRRPTKAILDVEPTSAAGPAGNPVVTEATHPRAPQTHFAERTHEAAADRGAADDARSEESA